MSGVWQKVEAAGIVTASFVVAAIVVRDRPAIEANLSHYGFLAYPIAIAIFAVVASAPFSVTDALAIMNGVIFGPWKGALINAIGIVCAAIVGYTIARRTAKLLAVEQYIERLPGWVTRFKVASPGFLLAVRVIPGLGGTVATICGGGLQGAADRAHLDDVGDRDSDLHGCSQSSATDAATLCSSSAAHRTRAVFIGTIHHHHPSLPAPPHYVPLAADLISCDEQHSLIADAQALENLASAGPQARRVGLDTEFHNEK